jgi:flagellar P-ring protein precursor FlgI
VISGEVEIGPVVVTHKNLVIEAGGAPAPAERFVGLESNGTRATSLKSLVEALNAVKLPTADVIDIIKGLEKNGKLQGKLVIE